MEIVKQPAQEWSARFTCRRCGTEFRADQGDLQVDGFKVSGAHWNGTAVCVDKFFVQCPSDNADILLGERAEKRVPVLLRDRLQGELDAKRRERGY